MILACAACGLKHTEKILECWYCGCNNSIIKMTQETSNNIKEKYSKMYNAIPRKLEDVDWVKEKKDLFG